MEEKVCEGLCKRDKVFSIQFKNEDMTILRFKNRVKFFVMT